MLKTEEIEKLVNDKLSGTDKFLVEIKISPQNSISVYIDSDSKLSIKDCVEVSRCIESHYDRDVIDYQLNVSSPGVDKAFTSLRQYKKHLNKEVKILLNDGKKLKGILIEIENNYLKIKPVVSKKEKKKGISPETIKISFDEIKKTKSVISFKK